MGDTGQSGMCVGRNCRRRLSFSWTSRPADGLRPLLPGADQVPAGQEAGRSGIGPQAPSGWSKSGSGDQAELHSALE
eukprot:6674215-Alexandrium_andersonii.AAC.1